MRNFVIGTGGLLLWLLAIATLATTEFLREVHSGSRSMAIRRRLLAVFVVLFVLCLAQLVWRLDSLS
jgi:hypothetical protein